MTQSTLACLVMMELMRHVLEGASAKGARSTALHSLQWGIGLLLAGIPASVLAQSPEWVIIVIVVLLSLVIAVYILAYLFLLFTDRDALRSEQFTLSKMAIERGLIGDNLTGLLEEHPGAKNLMEATVVSDEENEP